jgi:hypothetical protein
MNPHGDKGAVEEKPIGYSLPSLLGYLHVDAEILPCLTVDAKNA